MMYRSLGRPISAVVLGGCLAAAGCARPPAVPPAGPVSVTVGTPVEREVTEYADFTARIAAVDAGFDRAFSAILDANVTTIVAAVVLFQFGTGPVKGFAVTLTIGIAVSMFTAIFVSRAVFETVFRLRRVTALSI